ncbi:MAG: hypothetical protein JWQ29_2753 [Phenylobacterium sp.]|nr:hypothetical protein [Phenylobacterium sp.]
MLNSMRRLLGLAALGAALAAASTAGAATFAYSTDFSTGVGAEWTISAPVNTGDPGILGQLGDGPSSATLTRSSAGASAANGGTLTFDVIGFRTLDGVNCCTDVFNLIVNGVTVYQAAFSLGGGGGEAVYLNPNGATYTSSGSTRTLTVPFTAVTGSNSFQFLYPALQSFNDEAFGLDNVSFRAEVSAPQTNPIPEPSSWALMILGFGGVGAAMRNRRRTVLAA